MPRFFTHFWPDELCDVHYRGGLSGVPLEFTAGSGFLGLGVEPGDVIYILSAYDGQVMLVGRMTVNQILTSYSEALAVLAPDVEQAQEYVLAVEDDATPQYFTRPLTMEETGDLRFLAQDGSLKPLKFADDAEVDETALAGVRELAPASAGLLDQVLSQSFHDAEPDTAEGREEEEIGDGDLAAIARSFADESTNRRVREITMDFVASAFEEKGWTVMPVDDLEEGYDLQCTVGDDHLHVVVKGNVNNSLEFLLTELEYARAERDGHFALCLVTDALSDSPSLATFSGEDLYDLFDARPAQWAFRYRDEDDDFLDTEDF
jgi:hypothetical protein